MLEGTLIVPMWEPSNETLHDLLIQNASFLTIEKFNVGRRNLFDSRDISLDELTEKYAKKAISRAEKIGKKMAANIVFLYRSRGFGELGISAYFYSLRN